MLHEPEVVDIRLGRTWAILPGPAGVRLLFRDRDCEPWCRAGIFQTEREWRAEITRHRR